MEERHIYIYGEIGWEANANSVQEQIQAEGDYDKIIVHISSPGGGVFEGWTIGNIIKNTGKETVAQIEGLCASIATFIALSCNRVEMAETGRFMIHNPMTWAEGEEADIEQAAEQLAKIKDDLVNTYNQKTGIKADRLSEMMNDETWLTPEEAMAQGFIDAIIEPVKAVARFDIKTKNMPEVTDQKIISKMDEIIENGKKVLDKIFKNEIKNVTLQLADGGSIFVESEDGELEGKPAFTVDTEGNVTEEPAPNGTHELQDGRSITIEDGSVVSVQEAKADDEETDQLKAKIKQLEKDLATATSEKEEVENTATETQKQVSELVLEVQNLKKMTVGGEEPPAKQRVPVAPKNKFDENGDADHRLDNFADYLKNRK